MVGHPAAIVAGIAGVGVASLAGVAKEVGWRAAVGWRRLGSEGMWARQDRSCGCLGQNQR